jgi:hypothetical protein
MPHAQARQADAMVPAANLGMIRAGIDALKRVRQDGSATRENGDANIAYAVYEAMRAKYVRQQSSAED